MNHAELLQKLPSSIYTKEANSNNAKLWDLYSSQANEIEDAITPFYDVDSLSGINLDKMSLILGIEREGRNDIDYRNALLNFQDAEVDTSSLPALYTALAKVCDDFRITELAYPREYEDRICDGNTICDGLQNCDPAVKRAKILFFCDGSIIADGSEPAEPCFIRPASILIEVGQDTASFAEILSEARKILIPGIAIYIRLKEWLCSAEDFEWSSEDISMSGVYL